MNKKEFSLAFAMAKDDSISLLKIDNECLTGCALPEFKYPVFCTIVQVAALIRWDCIQFNGEFNSEELNNIGIIGKRKFIIVG